MQTIASKTIQEYHISEKDYVFINVNRHHKLKDEKMTSIYLCVYICTYIYIYTHIYRKHRNKSETSRKIYMKKKSEIFLQ